MSVTMQHSMTNGRIGGAGAGGGSGAATQQGFVAALKDGFGFIETADHTREVFFHFRYDVTVVSHCQYQYKDDSDIYPSTKKQVYSIKNMLVFQRFKDRKRMKAIHRNVYKFKLSFTFL